MKKITFNNEYTFTMESYNCTYNFRDGVLQKYINASLLNTDASSVAILAQSIITNIVITDGEDTLYELLNISGKVDTISESISNRNNQLTVYIGIQILEV